MLFMDYGFGAPVKKAVAKSTPAVKRSVAVTKVSPPKPAPRPAAKPALRPATKPAVVKVKPTSDAGVTKLQHTLNSLAQRTGDSALTLKVDGLIGPKTVSATNRAMVKYGAVAGAPAEVRTGRLTPAQVKDNASDLAYFVEKAVEKRLPKASPAVTKKVEAQKKAAVKKVAAVRSDAIFALQRALRALSAVVEDKALAVAIDGLIGPKTTAAVNRAMTTYVPKPPALYASGTLTQQAVVAAAPELTDLVIAAARLQRTAKQVQGRKAPTKRPPGEIPADADESETVPEPQLPPLPRIKIPVSYETAKRPPPAPGIEEPEITVPEPRPPAGIAPSPQTVTPDAYIPPAVPAPPAYEPPAAEEKKIPWPWIIAGGAGLIGAVTVTVLIARKKRR